MKNKKITITDSELCVFEVMDEIIDRFEKVARSYRDEFDDLPEDFSDLGASINFLKDLISLKTKINALAEKK